MGEVGRARGCFRFPRKGELLALSAALEGTAQRMASEMRGHGWGKSDFKWISCLRSFPSRTLNILPLG